MSGRHVAVISDLANDTDCFTDKLLINELFMDYRPLVLIVYMYIQDETKTTINTIERFYSDMNLSSTFQQDVTVY